MIRHPLHVLHRNSYLLSQTHDVGGSPPMTAKQANGHGIVYLST